MIRPLAYVAETDLERWAEVQRGFPIIPCNAVRQPGQPAARADQRMLREWERHYPGRAQNTFNALGRVIPSHLMDPRLYGFADLRATGQPPADGDIAFDEDPCTDGAEDPTLGVIRFAEAE